MIRFIFDLMSACAHFMWDILQALAHLGFSVLELLTWPFRTFYSAPLFWGFLLLLLGVIVMLTSRVRRYK